MAITKAESSETLMSRRWSTSELVDGLSHLLNDSSAELPDDMAKLQDSRALQPLCPDMSVYHLDA